MARFWDAELVTRYGRLAVPVADAGAEDDLITDFLRRYGEWAWLEAECVAPRLPRGARVLDGGAYLGTFGLGVAQLRALGFLCFAEANPAITPLLKRNARLCCHVPATVLSVCLAPENSTPCIGIADRNNIGSARFGRAAPSVGQLTTGLPERTATLADIVAEHGPFDLIKLDIEGAESEVLSDARFPPRSIASDLWVECLADERALALAELLLSAGRALWYYAFPAFNPNNHAGETASHLPFAYESAFLLEGEGRRPADQTPLPPRCIRRPIRTAADLRMALWLTPRFAPPGWEELGREELAAVSAHEMADERFETFLAERPSRWSSPLSRARAEIDALGARLAGCEPPGP